jgi:hypothetical protein
MKRCLLSALAVGLCLSANVMAQVPSYVPTIGLVGYWPFNGNANDLSLNNLDGVATGVDLVQDRYGILNSAYEFTTNGWNPGSQLSEVYIPYNSLFNTSQISISTWINSYDWGWPGSNSVVLTRFEQGYSTPNGQSWGVAVSLLNPFPLNNGEFYSVLFNQPQNTSSVIGQQIPINEWTHLLITFDGITQKQFVNGVFTSQINSPNGFELNQLGTSGISIGVSNQANGYWSPFNGIIDDIGIWNRALTQQEITDLFNGCSASTIANQPSNQTVNPTNSAQFVVNATSGTSFQWQTDLGLGFQNMSNAGQYSGANNDTLVVSNASISNNNQQFRCIVNPGSCADTSDIAVLSVSTVGMNELSVQGNVSLYPNPTQSSFEIQTNLVYSKIEIRDMQGRLVKTEKAAKTINLSSLQKGTYSVNLLDEQENTLAVRKIVLQ